MSARDGDAKCNAAPVRGQNHFVGKTFEEFSYGTDNRVAKSVS